MAYWSKYGVARKVRIPLVKRGVADHAVSADWTPAAGDVKISKDGGAAANVTNLPTAIAMGNSTIWEFSITATEMQAAQINVTIGDSTTKAVEDDGFDFETYGNASAQHAVDLSDAVRAGLTSLPNAAAEAAGGLFTRGTGAGQVNQDANGRLDTNVAGWKATTVPAANTAGIPIVDTRQVLRQGTAQAGASGSITLDSGASATDSLYLPCMVHIVAGTGLGQGPRIGLTYTGSTKVLTIVPAWTTNPSTDTVFQLLPAAADIEAWLRAAPSALTSGKVPASADLVTWLGSAPLALTSQFVQASVGANQAGVITSTAIATDAITSTGLAASAANEIRDAIKALVIEQNGSYTLQQALSVILAFAAGITSSGGTVIKDPVGTASRISATIDGSNNRTAMTLNPST